MKSKLHKESPSLSSRSTQFKQSCFEINEAREKVNTRKGVNQLLASAFHILGGFFLAKCIPPVNHRVSSGNFPSHNVHNFGHFGSILVVQKTDHGPDLNLSSKAKEGGIKIKSDVLSASYRLGTIVT